MIRGKDERALLKADDEASWTALLEKSESHLVVVDCHQDWCGICEAVQPVLQKTFQEYPDADDRLCLASASLNQISESIQNTLPADTSTRLDKNGCAPLFLLYRSSACIATVNGVDAPMLLQLISNNIPEKKKDDLDE